MGAAPVPLPDPFLPPELAALAEPPPPSLRSVALRLDPVTLARLEALRDRLNRPTRGALLRFLVGEGLRSAEAQLGGNP
jgi:hypothetical protein